MSFDPKKAKSEKLKNVKMTFSGERPKHIIGFSQVIAGDDPNYQIIYRAQRIGLTDNATDKQIQTETRKVIKYLQNRKLNNRKKDSVKSLTTNVSGEKVLSFDAFKTIMSNANQQYDDKNEMYKYKSKVRDKVRDKDIHWINKGGKHKQEFREPLFEINSPTLLVFTTSYPADFTQRVATENYIYPDTGYGLDPSLKNPMYVVNDGRVMLLFSSYQHSGCPASPKEYWYNLRFSFKYTDRNKKNVYLMDNPPHTFDPGNGSGSGESFP